MMKKRQLTIPDAPYRAILDQIQVWQIGYEALSLSKSFPTKLYTSSDTDAKRRVSVKIWLLPNNLLGSQHDKLIRDCSRNIINKAKYLMELLTEALDDPLDLLNKTTNFPILKKQDTLLCQNG